MPEIQWRSRPQKHDFPAAHSYLLLLYNAEKVAALVAALEKAEKVVFKAKDIFRASGLALLGMGNTHVNNDRAKIKSGEKLSPLLLVRDEMHGKVVIADGYHRLCAVYSFDEDALIPCIIV